MCAFKFTFHARPIEIREHEITIVASHLNAPLCFLIIDTNRKAILSICIYNLFVQRFHLLECCGRIYFSFFVRLRFRLNFNNSYGSLI